MGGAKNCPETPRQKMIGMMYLVLTALLALNVSKDILNAFVIVDTSLRKTTDNFALKNQMSYNAFDKAYLINKNKVGPWRDKAYEVKKMSQQLYDLILAYKMEILKKADGPEGNIDDVQAKDNTDIPAEIMIVKKKGTELRKAIEDYREFLLKKIVDPKDSSVWMGIKKNLNTDPPPAKEGKIESWESEHFEHLPLIAIMTFMSKMQSDIRNAEADAINYLYTKIDEASFKFNKLEALFIAKSNYVMSGSKYSASVFLAASDTSKDPRIWVTETPPFYDSVKMNDGTYSYTMVKDKKYDTLVVKEGKGLYEVQCSGTGYRKWGGLLEFKAPDGSFRYYPYKGEYQVAQAGVVVSPTKMNVFYIGVDNPVDISVPGVPADKISAFMSGGGGGTISRDPKGGPGAWIVKVTKIASIKDPCLVNVTADIDGTKRNMGNLPFRVKQVPDPVGKVAGLKGGTIGKGLLKAQSVVVAEMENFDFDLKFIVVEFNVSATIKGFEKSATSKSARFTDEQMSIIDKLTPGQKVYIEGIKVKGPDGSVRTLSPILFKLN